MKHLYAALFSIIIGTLYYEMMWKSLPKEANCSFMATPMTDILAFAWGVLVVVYGMRYDNPLLTFLGSTVFVEHVWQLVKKS